MQHRIGERYNSAEVFRAVSFSSFGKWCGMRNLTRSRSIESNHFYPIRQVQFAGITAVVIGPWSHR